MAIQKNDIDNDFLNFKYFKNSTKEQFPKF